MSAEKEDTEEYICLINEEEQYSFWFQGERNTSWMEASWSYVKENWTDMRPKSLREKMDILLNN